MSQASSQSQEMSLAEQELDRLAALPLPKKVKHSIGRKIAYWLIVVPLIFPYVAYISWKYVGALNQSDFEKSVYFLYRRQTLNNPFRRNENGLSLIDRSKYAYILFVGSKLEKSQRLFARVLEDIGTPKSDKEAYVKFYARHWLAVIKGEPFSAEYEAVRARNTSYKTGLLWIPDYDDGDQLDREFNESLSRAASEQGLSVKDFLRQQIVK